jgi:hypothetical protein
VKTLVTSVLIAALSIPMAPPLEAGESDTLFRTSPFTLTLPGRWQRIPSEEAFVFKRGTDEVFVTYLEPEKPLPWKESKRVASKLANIRQKALRDLSGGTATFSQVLGTVKDERQVFTFTGTDPKNMKRFYVAVIGLPRVFVTVAVYRPLARPANDFADMSNGIMWSVRPPAG